VAEEEPQVSPPEPELSSKEVATAKGIFSFPPKSFPIRNIDDVLIVCLSNLLQGLLHQLRAKLP